MSKKVKNVGFCVWICCMLCMSGCDSTPASGSTVLSSEKVKAVVITQEFRDHEVLLQVTLEDGAKRELKFPLETWKQTGKGPGDFIGLKIEKVRNILVEQKVIPKLLPLEALNPSSNVGNSSVNPGSVGI